MRVTRACHKFFYRRLLHRGLYRQPDDFAVGDAIKLSIRSTDTMEVAGFPTLLIVRKCGGHNFCVSQKRPQKEYS